MSRYTPEANAAIEQLQAAGFDYAEADMIYHGDKLGSALGAKTAALITSLRAERDEAVALHTSVETDAAVWVKARRAQFEAEITSLREALERKDAALKPFANMLPDSYSTKDALQARLQEWCRDARTALNPKERLDALLERARFEQPLS
jgi:hypothetical protein